MARYFAWALALVLLVSQIGTASAAATLTVGDPAPKLDVDTFVQGDPVGELKPGTIYVIEFWATWCVPCKESAPHLNELQKAHPDVVFIGVDLIEERALVENFIKEMAGKMSYRIAIDKKLKSDDEQGVMGKNWLDASGQDGIPTAFIIDKDGKTAWIGHPSDMDDPFGKIIAGKWDLDAEAKKYAEQMATKKKQEAMVAEIAKAIKDAKYDDALALVEQGISQSLVSETDYADTKLALLIALKKNEPALTYGKHLIDELFTDDSDQMLAVAGVIVRPDDFSPLAAAEKKNGSDKPEKMTVDPDLAKLAVQAAKAAAKLTESEDDVKKRVAVNEILAAAYMADAKPKHAATALKQAVQDLKTEIANSTTLLEHVQAELKDAGEKGGDEDEAAK